MIINGCTLDWDNEQKCGGFVKIVYKRIQSLNTGKNRILVGVPMDTCADSLQQVLREKMEEAREKMVTKNPYKYGTTDKVPHFMLERNFVKNTPYAECSEEDNIPFWLRNPYHLEYVFCDGGAFRAHPTLHVLVKKISVPFGGGGILLQEPRNGSVGFRTRAAGRSLDAPYSNGLINE